MAIFSPTSRFNKVDLPTLGAPIIEMKPDLKSFRISHLTFVIGHRARSQESESRIQEDQSRVAGILEYWNDGMLDKCN